MKPVTGTSRMAPQRRQKPKKKRVKRVKRRRPRGAAKYRQLKRWGRCVRSYVCREPVYRASLCKAHWKAQKKAHAKSRVKLYEYKKSLSICGTTGCFEDAVPGKVHCQRCRDHKKSWHKVFSNTKSGKKKIAKYNRRKVAKRKALGLCIHCSDPAVTKGFCQRHRELQLARRHERKPLLMVRACSVCKETGHNIRNCPVREAAAAAERMRDLHIDEFGGARQEAA